jgi:hypothetical protein
MPDTLEDRLAEIAVSLNARALAQKRPAPAYADFLAAFRPFVRTEFLLAQLKALDTPHHKRPDMRAEFTRELHELSGIVRRHVDSTGGGGV